MKWIVLGLSKWTALLLTVFVFCFFVGTKLLSAEPTVLHLNFQDDQNQSIIVTQAVLILVTGNYIDRLPLTVQPDGLDFVLNKEWLMNHWPGGNDRFNNLDRAYLFLKSPGYASICSDPINWMGGKTDVPDKNVVLSFPHGKTVVVARGQKASFTLNFRKQTPRFLRLIDKQKNPIQGVRVKSYIYWSRNGTGELNKADWLGDNVSDAAGKVPVVDGDFTYAFQVTYQGNPGGTFLIVKRFQDKEDPIIGDADLTPVAR